MKGRGLVGSALLAVFCATSVAAAPLIGPAGWYRAKLGPFEAISNNGRPAAIQALSQFEQFRNALGVAMGVQDLRLNPPLRILVFRDALEMAAQG